MSGPRVVVSSEAELAEAAAAWIADAIEAAVAARGRCSLALAGGATPRPVYERLAQRPLATRVPWEVTDVYFGDERAVPPDHPMSNYRMADEALLGRVPIPRAQVYRMRGEDPDLDAAARAYERLLPERLDLLVLGVGADGHTASLFPGAPALRARTRRVVPAAAPAPPARRLTVTPPVIEQARAIVVIVAARGKAAAVARALDGPYAPSAVPIQLALGGTWIMDRAAAAALQEQRA